MKYYTNRQPYKITDKANKYKGINGVGGEIMDIFDYDLKTGAKNGSIVSSASELLETEWMTNIIIPDKETSDSLSRGSSYKKMKKNKKSRRKNRNKKSKKSIKKRTI